METCLLCDRPPKLRGLCNAHYRRLVRHGDPLVVKRALDGEGSTTGDGYRVLTIGGKRVLEHRKVWEDTHGPIPTGYHVHHRNRNKLDNRLANLELHSRKDHGAIHSHHQRRTTPDGSWARYFAECRRCDTTERRHKAFGLCVNCWEVDRRRIRRERRARQQRPAPPWSRQAPACVSCGTTAVGHEARGLCMTCHERSRSLRRHPTRRSLAPGQWSRQHPACLRCSTTAVRHKADGLCRNCWLWRYRQTHDLTIRAADCAVESCGRPAWARSYCDTHLWHFRKYGDPLAGRFHRKSHKNSLAKD